MAVNYYYTQITKYALLTAAEEKLYSTQALLGDEEAAHALVNANLRFVVTVAKQYERQGVPLEDLINEGNMGLMTAVRKYDPTRKYKFITYASYWIRQSILKALAEQNRTIRIPTNKIALLSKIRNITDKLTLKLERRPTQIEIEDELGGDIDISQIYEIEDRPIELDGTISSSEESLRCISETIADTSQPSPDDLMRPEMFMEELENILSNFSEREKDILYLYYGIGTGGAEMTLEQIGHIYGICRERVRQVKKAALKKMLQHPEIDRLREFL